jgi:hypothetical protein
MRIHLSFLPITAGLAPPRRPGLRLLLWPWTLLPPRTCSASSVRPQEPRPLHRTSMCPPGPTPARTHRLGRHGTLRLRSRFGLDPPVDMSSWPDFPPTSPPWAPTDPPPAYVPVPLRLLHRLRLDSPSRTPPPHPHPDVAESIAGAPAGPPLPGATPLFSTTSLAPPQDAFPPPRRARSSSPGPRPPTPGGRSPPPSPRRTSSRSGLPPARLTYLFDDTCGFCLSQGDWEALRLSTLEAITTLAAAKAAKLNAELAVLRDECTNITHTVRGSLTASPEQSARIQAISTEITQQRSAWRSCQAAFTRAILDLNAADTSPLASAAINAAIRLLELPARDRSPRSNKLCADLPRAASIAPQLNPCETNLPPRRPRRRHRSPLRC